MLVLYCTFNKVLSTGASVKVFYEGLGNGQRLAGCILKVCWGKQETVRKIKGCSVALGTSWDVLRPAVPATNLAVVIIKEN